MCFGGGGGGDKKKTTPAPTTPTYNDDPTASANRQRALGMGIGNMTGSEAFGSTLGAAATPASMPTMSAGSSSVRK